MFGRLIECYLINKICLNNESIPNICSNEYGKPFIDSRFRFQYSISHSDRWVVCVINDQPIGIDIERIKPIDLRIVDRFFSKSEQKFLAESNINERLERFYTIWTLKESYIKAVGKGLFLPLDSFSVKKTREEIYEVECNNEDHEFYLATYKRFPYFIISVCSKRRDKFNKVEVLDFYHVYQYLMNKKEVSK
ncbi:4'-phosphopantetheinyl transferase superfamily protein [Vallitalea pronyensis]|uniref:4'-phosphopantetheinyl transferase superfamily protein n=1 Tax=Vallitalea pronyensis TaxID=1348613 RepID=A0A8J8SHR3_9FIRM|nr:4'-phosphopantetheinyl transferase superfamily protein [Vallitalea pronyensis]QUI23831.1 4'-phosphopantetheinyl transferase superfamily protein [Vallitalea pronyensis]